MSASSDSTLDSRALRVYRIPAYQKRTRGYDDRVSVPYVRSPSPEEKILVARRRQSSPVRIVEVKSPPSTTYVKRYYPHTRTTRVIREQSPLSTTSDSASSISTPPPVSIVKRRQQDQRVVRIATTSTSAGSNNDYIVPITKKRRREVVETPVAIVSETPLVTRGTSPRKQWKKREKTIPLDLDRDVYVSDEDYYEEAFPDGSYKPKSYKFCKWCHGKCARRCPHCNFCEWYYSCPFCCWLTCLLLSLGFLIGIFVLLGFLPETNPSRRPVNTQEVNTTINAIQQNLPCDPITTFNASSTLIRCIDTTPVYIYTVVAQSFSRASQLNIFNSYFFCLLFFILKNIIEQYELDYLFPSMIFEPALKLTPPYQKGTYSYTFVVPPASKLYGPHVAFYLFAGQPSSKTAAIVINQDGNIFQNLTGKQYWQSNKVPMPLTINKTTIDLHVQDGDEAGPTYTIHVTRASE